LPNINGEVWNIARQDKNVKISTSGVFSESSKLEGVGYATNTITDIDGFVMSFGNDKRHNNLSPCVSAYVWKRTA
jgi:hypothetical protein